MTHKNHFDGEIYAQCFDAGKQLFPNVSIDWLTDLRQSSLDQFLNIGIPGPRVEEWKYTNLTNLKSNSYGISSVADSEATEALSKILINELSGSKVVFVDGYYNETLTGLNKPDGLSVFSLNEFIKNKPEDARSLLSNVKDENSLGKLNLALMTDGYVIIVNEDVKLAEPIEIIHIATSNSSSKALRTRNFIHLEKGSQATVIESFYGDDQVDYWRQNVSKISLQKDALLEIYQFQREGNDATHMDDTDIGLEQNATLRHYSINLGGKISRTEIKPTLNGLHGNVELRGAFMSRGNNAHDVMTHMKHLVPGCESDQIYRGVLDKGGKSAFQGKVYVAKDAQLTNADQSNKNLILDRSAEANSKPELLIYADDVKCSHGATVGELDQEALFYLKSRGINHTQAKALLVKAFINEVFESISLDAVRDRYLDLAGAWLEEGV